MMMLPYPPLQAHLRSMWLLSNLLAAVVLGFIITILAGPAWFVLPLGVFTALALVGLRLHKVQGKVYRGWNRLAGLVQRIGFRWILFLSHGLLLRAIGPVNSKFDADRSYSGRTAWTRYPSRFRSVSPNQQSGPIEEVVWTSWIQHYLGWARADGNRWALLLLPFLMILALFRESDENAPTPSNIYTLF